MIDGPRHHHKFVASDADSLVSASFAPPRETPPLPPVQPEPAWPELDSGSKPVLSDAEGLWIEQAKNLAPETPRPL